MSQFAGSKDAAGASGLNKEALMRLQTRGSVSHQRNKCLSLVYDRHTAAFIQIKIQIRLISLIDLPFAVKHVNY